MPPSARDISETCKGELFYKLIAGECNISLDTVKMHIRNIYKKLQVYSKEEVVANAKRKRIV